MWKSVPLFTHEDTRARNFPLDALPHANKVFPWATLFPCFYRPTVSAGSESILTPGILLPNKFYLYRTQQKPWYIRPIRDKVTNCMLPVQANFYSDSVSDSHYSTILSFQLLKFCINPDVP